MPHTLPIKVQTLIERIPLFFQARQLRATTLENTPHSHNTHYRITADGTDYLLRFAAEDAHTLGIYRDEEQAAARAAAAAGIAPAILYAEPDGHLVMPFLPGHRWSADECAESARILRLAETLRRLHSLRAPHANGSIFHRIQRLLDSIRALGMELPPNQSRYQEHLCRLEAQRNADKRFPPGLAHNNFWTTSFLDHNNTLSLFDWEFSGNGDGLIDLATIAIGCNYNKDQQRLLLDSYGYRHTEDLQTLQGMKYVALCFEAFWALVQHGIHNDTTAFDYLSYARRTFHSLDTATPP